MSNGDKINVLFVQSQPAMGADSLVHVHLMRYLDRARFRVHVACTRGDGNGVPPSLATIREIPDIDLRPTYFLPGLSQRKLGAVVKGLGAALPFPVDAAGLVAYARKRRIDIVHGTEKPRDVACTVALGRLLGAKSIVHVHVKWSNEYSRVARFGVQHASAALGISEYVSQTIVDMGKPRSSVITVLNSLDPLRWDPDRVDGTPVRREFGIGPEVPLLVSVSRLFSWKGQRELVRAMAIVKREVPNVRLLIVGDDEPYVHGGSFTEELKRLTREHGVEANVTFTGGRKDIPEIIQAADVYAMPSFEEPFGIVFLEAMAMRKPVAAVNNGGTPEVVDDGRAGLLSPPWDVERLAENLLTLIRDGELRKRMGEYGRRRVLEYFSPERAARETGAAYERLLGAR